MGKGLGTALIIIGILIALFTGGGIVFALYMVSTGRYALNMAGFTLFVVLFIIGVILIIGGIILRKKG